MVVESNRNYSSIVLRRRRQQQNESAVKLDADVIVIGAGIAGASIAHHCRRTDASCRVLVLEQYAPPLSEEGGGPVRVNRGSSRGGPRRIGTIGGDDRVKQAWCAWQKLDQEYPDSQIWDVAGEVYVVQFWPMGWILVTFLFLWYTYTVYVVPKEKQSIPKGFRFLWTSKEVEEKLGPPQGFRSGCWAGCFGIYYDDAAALHTDRVLKLFLQESHNLAVQYGVKVNSITLQEHEAMSDKVVSISASKDGDPTWFKCRHVVVAGGGWTGELLPNCFRGNGGAPLIMDPSLVKTKIEVFTCPVYEINTPGATNNTVASPPPFSLESGCPVFSCIHKKMYGFPIRHQDGRKRNEPPFLLSLRSFSKSHDGGNNPDDTTVSPDQKAEIDQFVQDVVAPGHLTYSHCYTCRYPKLSLDGGKSFRPIFDFVPGSNRQIVVHAGLDGYSFKFGSIFGQEFLELLATGTPPKGLEWPMNNSNKDNGGEGNVVVRLFRSAFVGAMKLWLNTIETKDEDASKKEN